MHMLFGKVYVHSFNTASYEPRHEKICHRGLRPGQTQNGLYSHRRDLNLILRRELVPSDLHLLFPIYTISESKPLFIRSARFGPQLGKILYCILPSVTCYSFSRELKFNTCLLNNP